MSNHEVELGESLIERIQSYGAIPCDIANTLTRKVEEFSATSEGSSFGQEHLLWLIERYAIDPSSAEINKGMCCLMITEESNTSVSLEDKKKLLDTIKDRARELKKALRAGKIEEVQDGIKQLGRRIIEVPLHPTNRPGVFGRNDAGYTYLIQAVNKWFSEEKSILKGTLGTALSKHLDLMEKWDVPREVVRMILLKICN